MKVVIQVRTGRDHEIYQTAIHHLDHAPAEARGRHRTGDRQPNGRVVVWRQHLLGKNLAGFGQSPRVEGLEAVVDEASDLAAAGRPVVTNRFSRQKRPAGLPGRPWGTVRQETISLL